MTINKNVKKTLSVLLVLGLSLFAYINDIQVPLDNKEQKLTKTLETNNVQKSNFKSDLNSIEKAFASKKSDLQVSGFGKVSKILRDDLEGHKHQKFILRLNSGNSILIAHNIDLAPRIPRLKKGDLVKFYGEYEYNSQGGVVHWTHDDPNHRHLNGWLEHDGIRYK